MASCQKKDIILENKGIQKLKISKKVHNKKCAHKFVVFNEKNQKDGMIFDVEN